MILYNIPFETILYYIDIDEILGFLCCVKMISSHMHEDNDDANKSCMRVDVLFKTCVGVLYHI